MHRSSRAHHEIDRLCQLSHRWGMPLVLVLLSTLGGGVLSCSGDTLNGPPVDQAKAYWALQLNQHAVNLALAAPYDTAQLNAIPRNAMGLPLTGLGPITYTTLDTSIVAVSPAGLITARHVTNGTPVIASLQDVRQGVTHTDTVWVQITQSVPAVLPFRTFSLQPAGSDSAKRARDVSPFAWPVHVADARGATVCDTTGCALLVRYTSSDTSVATIDPNTGEVTSEDTGHVVFTATTLAYGETLRDSVAFTVGYAIHPEIFLTLATILGVLTLGVAAPKKLILGVGSVVTFCSHSPQPVDIVFDHPESVDSASCGPLNGHFAQPTGSGNIPAFGGVMQFDTSFDANGGIARIDTNYFSLADVVCRRFSVPGVYRYHSTLFPSDTFELDIRQEH